MHWQCVNEAKLGGFFQSWLVGENVYLLQLKGKSIEQLIALNQRAHRLSQNVFGGTEAALASFLTP